MSRTEPEEKNGKKEKKECFTRTSCLKTYSLDSNFGCTVVAHCLWPHGTVLWLVIGLLDRRVRLRALAAAAAAANSDDDDEHHDAGTRDKHNFQSVEVTAGGRTMKYGFARVGFAVRSCAAEERAAPLDSGANTSPTCVRMS